MKTATDSVTTESTTTTGNILHRICSLLITNALYLRLMFCGIFFISDVSEILAVSVNITVYGVNETSFDVVQPVLESVIADITGSSVSSVQAVFVEMLPTTTSRDLDFYVFSLANIRTIESNEYGALINVTVTPTDVPHEIEVLDTMNDTFSFLSDVNAGLLDQWEDYNATVISVSSIERTPGNLIYCMPLQNLK